VDSLSADEAEDPVRRRTFTRLAGASLVGAILADTAAGAGPLRGAEAFATALLTPDSVPATAQPADLPALTTAVANAKRAYQSCRYAEAMSHMPTLLPVLQATCDHLDGDAKLRAYTLTADAYHVVASILIKLDDHGLAWLAADRSMRAATLSQEPLAVGTSARIITHALMADGHFGAATTVASTHAQRLAADTRNSSAESLSVYGSLLLRGALAAAHAEDRDSSITLLDEAGQAGSRLGSDYNHRWTAFGPANVLLHRVNAAVRLGDPRHQGQARLDRRLSGIEHTLSEIANRFDQPNKQSDAIENELRQLAQRIEATETAQRDSVAQLRAELNSVSGRTVEAAPNITPIRPAISSVNACALPGYVTCTSLTPARALNSSPARCEAVPRPDEP